MAKYPIKQPQKILKKTTIQKINDPDVLATKISLKKRREIVKPKRLLTIKSIGINNFKP